MIEFFCEYLRMFEIAKNFDGYIVYSRDEFLQKFFHQGFLAFSQIFSSTK